MPSIAPNLLNSVTGSSEPLEGLLMDGPPLLDFEDLFGWVLLDEDAAGLEDAVVWGLLLLFNDEEDTDIFDVGGVGGADVEVACVGGSTGSGVCVAMQLDENVIGASMLNSQVRSVWVDTVCADLVAEAYDLPTVGVCWDCL